MIRVAHISGARSWRGAEQQIALLLRANTRDIENYLFCPQGSALQQHSGDVQERVGSYTKYFGLDIAGAWKLKRFAEEKKLNLLHVHDSHALNLYRAARILGLRIPAVLTRHVCFKPGNPYKYKGDAIKRIICVSGTVKAIMSVIAGPEKCVVIHPGIAFPETVSRNRLRHLLGLDEQAMLVGTVCALEAEKNIPAFLRIAQHVLKEQPNVQFVIIGDGSMRGQITEQIQSLGLTERIRLTGFRDDVAQLLPDLDVFLFTSASEGFPLAPAESLVAGVPVVARQIPGIAELIRDGESGRLFSGENEAVEIIGELLHREDMRQQLIRQGKDHAKQFSVERLIEKTHNLYREIIV